MNSPTPTLVDWINRFLEDRQVRGFSPRTLENNTYDLKHLVRFLASRDVTDVRVFTPNLLRDFQHWLHYQPSPTGSVRGVGRHNHILCAVKTLVHYLRKEGILAFDPSEAIELAREPHTLPRSILTPAEARKILENVPTDNVLGYRDRTMLEVFYASGIRNQELRQLKVADVNLEDELLRVNEGKGGYDRVVPLSSVACRYLETYLKAIRPQLLKGKLSEWLFVSRRGRQIDRNNASKLVRLRAKAAGVKKHVTCHVWRHSCATHLLKNNANLRHVQAILGHKSLATTERYLHLNITDLKAAHRRFHPREKDGC